MMARAHQAHPGVVVADAVFPGSQSQWIEVDEESGLVGHVVETASLFIEGKILGIRRDGKDTLAPPPDTQLVMGDTLLVIFAGTAVEEDLYPEQPQKIVLVDDNPVIRRLYTRLFQKAGFNIITSSTGREGCDMILREQPDAAVVDYLLNDISGLEVCELVRESEAGQDVKLFLFTADERQEVRDNAMKVGVDMVVLKSPDASEIVNRVCDEVAHDGQKRCTNV